MQQGRQGLCEEADEPAAPAERGPNFSGVPWSGVTREDQPRRSRG
jgi:hypothetical protein